MTDRKDNFTHLDASGNVHMVNISEKEKSLRQAVASGTVIMEKSTITKITNNKNSKGNVLAVARIAGIMAAKKTSELIPLAHPIAITGTHIEFEIGAQSIEVTAYLETTDRTGIEMEAMTAVSMALLTIYDMCKGSDRGMVISGIKLMEKKGGRSGHFTREN